MFQLRNKWGAQKLFLVCVGVLAILLFLDYNWLMNYEYNFIHSIHYGRDLQHCNSMRTLTGPGLPPFITFIIPTKGRRTLSRTLESLVNQTIPNWEAIVLLDGVTNRTGWICGYHPNWLEKLLLSTNKLVGNTSDVARDAELAVLKSLMKFSNDHRFKWLSLNKTGIANHAGALRNIAIKNYVHSNWTGFVDDDDLLVPRYIEHLVYHAMNHSIAQVVIFRMAFMHGDILPELNVQNFEGGHVGISFAMRTSLCKIKGLCFVPGALEDIVLLDTMRSAGVPILISPYLAYRIRGPGVPLPDKVSNGSLIQKVNGNFTFTLIP